MGYSLFIDDERHPPYRDGRDWKIARDWEDVMMLLRIHGIPNYISFDHDLGIDKHSGHDIVKFLIDLDMGDDDMFTIPADFTYYVHSQNPVGKDNIAGLIDGYLKFRKENS